jgi:thiol-disulfide isomerase/thioredoxin
MPRLTCLAAVLGLFIASAAFAQTTTAPKTPHPAHRGSAKSSDQTSGDPQTGDAQSSSASGYPDAPKKELYAEVDLRGKPAPAFHVEKWITANGEPNRKDKTVLIDFWATWCGPCKKLIPELSDWQKQFKDDLVVIGVSDEKADVVSEFVKHTSIGYAIAVDTKATMENVLKVKGIPHVMVISSDGIVRWQGNTKGEPDTLTTEKLKQIIDADKAARAKKGATDKSTDPKADKSKTTTTK